MNTKPTNNHIAKATVWKWALAIVMGLSAFIFWRYGYPSMMAYQEQYQLFLFDCHYLVERLALPGGTATYVAEFFTQFYNTPVFGALVISLLLVTSQQLSWLLMRNNAYKTEDLSAYLLSFLPSLLIWRIMGDESLMLAYIVAFIIVQAAMIFAPKTRNALLIYILPAIPITYWIAGPMVGMLALYTGIRLIKTCNRKIEGFSLAAFSLVYTTLIVAASSYFLPYPTVRFFLGLFYYRSIEVPTHIMCLSPMLLLILTGVTIPLANKLCKTVAVAVVTVVASSLGSAIDSQKYVLMDYDCLVRQQRWADIVAKAEQKTPDLPMSVCATNLALAMTGKLGDRCFDFYQHGTEGLLPEFERNFNTILVTGDAYFMLGLVNTGQRYAFEAMESIPNYNKSGRVFKRLAETNLINGQYKAAEKYLKALQKTIFYKKWADRRMEMIRNPKLIDSHPMYSYLRKVRLTDDFLFSDKETDKLCGQLVMHNKENLVAIQYLLMFPLLNKDLNTFMQYYTYVKSISKYSSQACEEAVALAYAQQGKLPQAQMERYKSSPVWRYFLK